MLKDKWNEGDAALKLDDLEALDVTAPVNLSILMSINDYRRNQLARSLECLARQDWKEFEVLVCDNGSRQPLEPVFSIFRPYLRMKTLRLERRGFSACPSLGFRNLLPMAEGVVIAIMQPEIMLMPDAAELLYGLHFRQYRDVHRYKINRKQETWLNGETWVLLKPYYFNEAMFDHIDKINWHGNLDAIKGLPNFYTHTDGLGRTTNVDTMMRREYPWWFVGSARRDAGIWADMPIFHRHASIDQWLLNYRRIRRYIDLAPREPKGYHQWHFRKPFVSRVPEDVMPEIQEIEKFDKMTYGELRMVCKSYGIKLDNPGFEVNRYDAMWQKLIQARKADDNIRGNNAEALADRGLSGSVIK